MPTLLLVDKNDNVIGSKDRALRTPEDRYRISTLWIANSRGDVLLAQRSLTKKDSPGQWGPAVSGTHEVGETYDSNIIKETFEELGLQLTIHDLKKLSKTFRQNERVQYFTQRYLYVTDKTAEDFMLQQDEVARVRWFTPEELRKAVAENPDNFLFSVKQWVTGEFAFDEK